MNEVAVAVDAVPFCTGVRVGDGAGSRRGVRELRGVLQLEALDSGEALGFASLVGEESGVCGLVGELKGLVGEVVGVVGRSAVDGDAGDSGRRKGEVRGDPNERGEGLYRDWRLVLLGLGKGEKRRGFNIPFFGEFLFAFLV